MKKINNQTLVITGWIFRVVSMFLTGFLYWNQINANLILDLAHYWLEFHTHTKKWYVRCFFFCNLVTCVPLLFKKGFLVQIEKLSKIHRNFLIVLFFVISNTFETWLALHTNTNVSKYYVTYPDINSKLIWSNKRAQACLFSSLYKS